MPASSPGGPAAADDGPACLLAGLVAVEIGGTTSQLCGRALVDLGTTVIKIEPATGDEGRSAEPRSNGASIPFSFRNAGKQSVVVDPESTAGRAQTRLLLANADIFVTDLDDKRLATYGLAPSTLMSDFPDLVVSRVLGFGQPGPYRDFLCPDLVGSAMGGFLYISGAADRPPVVAPGEQAFQLASAFALQATTLALWRRQTAGIGGVAEVAIQEAVATMDQVLRVYGESGQITRRRGSQHAHVAPGRIFKTRDGFVYLFVAEQHWGAFIGAWKDHPAEFDNPELNSVHVRIAQRDVVNAQVASFVGRHTTAEFVALMGEAGIPCTPVNTLRGFLGDRQVASRGLLQRVRHPGLPLARQVAFPAVIDGARRKVSPAPELGQHTAEVFRSVALRPRRPTKRGAATPARQASDMALTGVRVVELTTGIAGPLTGRWFAEAGADVIKIESRHGGLDGFRQFSAGKGVDGSARFLESNLGVRSLRLNLRDPAGLAVANELLAKTDILLTNFRPDVLPRLGLADDHLTRSFPRLVVVKASGFGGTGPRSHERSWGPNLLVFTGMSYLWSHADAAEPVGAQSVYPDYLSAALTPALAVAALIRRARTGRGAVIDVSQSEVVAYALGSLALEQEVNQRDVTPSGNRSVRAAPHGCYPARGEDRWVVIAIETDDQWRQFCLAIDRADLLGDEYATTARRLARADELDSIIAAHTSRHPARELMIRLQSCGVPCGVVQDARELFHDPQLAEREVIIRVTHPVLGEVAMPRSPIRLTGQPGTPVGPAPLLGEHDEQIVCGLLGHTRDELSAWQDAGVIA